MANDTTKSGLLGKLSTLIESKVGLENDLAAARARIEELEADLSAAEEERDSLSGDLSGVREALAAATSDLEDATAREAELKEALEAAEAEAVSVQGAAADAVASEFGADPRDLPAQTDATDEASGPITAAEAAERMRSERDPAKRAELFAAWRRLSDEEAAAAR